MITVGMAVINDFAGPYFTTQALRLLQDSKGCEFLIVDNGADDTLRDWCDQWGAARYVRANAVAGTAYPRQQVFEEASCDWVLCLDSHVLLWPGALKRLKAFVTAYPECDDLLQGPLLYDDLRHVATHFKPEWMSGMWGKWACDPRGTNPDGPAFEIPMQGLGLFCCRKAAWPGFNPLFRGFGGEEGYIHAKFKQRGDRTLCLPWLRWCHLFRPRGTPPPYRHDPLETVRNYLIGHAEVGFPLEPILDHFLALGYQADVLQRLLHSAARDSLGAGSNV
jgi:hypothetical protein